MYLVNGNKKFGTLEFFQVMTYIVIRLPHLKDLDQKIPSFPNCDNYRICRASNPLDDDMRTNDNELHQQLYGTFKIDYLQEMDIITKV